MTGARCAGSEWKNLRAKRETSQYKCKPLRVSTHTFVGDLVEGTGDYPQLRVRRIADLHHQRDPHDALGLVLRLGHVVVQLLIEAV